MKVYTALVRHKHGTNQYVATTEDELFDQLFEYVKGEWDGVFGSDVAIPEDRKDAVHYYFNNCQAAGEEDNMEDVDIFDVSCKVHVIVAIDTDSSNTTPEPVVFIGQTRKEACNKFFTSGIMNGVGEDWPIVGKLYVEDGDDPEGALEELKTFASEEPEFPIGILSDTVEEM